jgi:hypothetical protein
VIAASTGDVRVVGAGVEREDSAGDGAPSDVDDGGAVGGGGRSDTGDGDGVVGGGSVGDVIARLVACLGWVA